MAKLARCRSWQSFEETAAFHDKQDDILACLTGMKHEFTMEDLPLAVRKIDTRYKIFLFQSRTIVLGKSQIHGLLSASNFEVIS